MIPFKVYAHHPLSGTPMETFAHGILSGVGHPLLGFDHLFFVLVIGVAAVFTARRYSTPFAYIVAMLLGCLAMAKGVGLPAKELVIAVSLIVLGAAVFRGKTLGIAPTIVLFAGFGLFHGSAFGDSIVAQEASLGTEVLIGYLMGLGVIQYAVAFGAGWFIKNILHAVEANDIRVRISGGMVAGAGALLLLENLESMVFSAIGIGS
jgi:urease accessory protein